MNLQSGEGWGEMDGARDEQDCFLLAGTSLSLNLHGTPRVLINKREICFLLGAGDCGIHQHHAAAGRRSRESR